MNGILYGEMLLILFFVVFVLYSLVYLISRVLIEKNKTVKNEETIKNEKLTIKDIVSMSVMLSVTFGIIIGCVCWIINAKVVVVLIFWYFSILFFTAAFFMLFINKTLRIYRNLTKEVRNKSRNKHKETNGRNERERLSEKIWAWNEKKQHARGWRKVLLYFGWFICLILETLKEFILALMRVIKDLLRLLFIGFPKWLLVQVKKLLDLLEQDLGKAIIISSRISLVGALLIVYLVDKYQKVLSAEGSDVYEFLCSVIMIPFLITQLSALRRAENSEKK